MRKLILFTVALLCAASLWADEMEGPWKYESMRSGTCGTDINQTISYNQLDNSRWGTITSWHNETDGIGFTVSGSSTKTSKNGVFSLYSLTRTIPSYSKCNYAWKYQIVHTIKEPVLKHVHLRYQEVLRIHIYSPHIDEVD